MISNITLAEVKSFLNRTATDLYDEMYTMSSDMGFKDMCNISIQDKVFFLAPTAQKQLCHLMRIPHNYIVKCHPSIQKVNLNYWLKTLHGKDLFFRMQNNMIRAVFTSKYQKIDNLDIINKLLEFVNPETKVRFRHNANFMSLAIVQNTSVFALDNQDEYKAGFTICNSEVGYKAFSLDTYLYRVICSNGMIVRTTLKYTKVRHIVKNFLSSFNLPAYVNTLQAESNFLKQDLIRSKVIQIPPDLNLEEFNTTRFHLSDIENRAVSWGLSQEPGNTLYHLINAYTRGAQQYELSPDSQHTLETIGGIALTLGLRNTLFQKA